ncbi:MAG: putative KH and PIN-domain containing protein [Candidatus Argoarchaeum ethanivorans]|uniref:Putative KH and PIN-domain containing protein n=1 Tax=Candidatus Argoarchaeum ethanivorans TaxID=2608793 RepID=A0A811TG87_9EURY|nr:MAG: putative KH and PIN-domain containing protein [Candidatus Argoarchaeum ethanivorans]
MSDVSDLVIVPDTSVIADGRITAMIGMGCYHGAILLVHEAVVAELESQANKGKETGFSGLKELQQLFMLSESGTITLEYVGKRPSFEDVKLASGGEIDAMIRKTAVERGALFVTSDIIQAEVAKARGLSVEYLKPESTLFAPLTIEQYFTEDTMSVHLKENTPPLAKRGTVGIQKLIQIDDAPLNAAFLRDMSHEILERAKKDQKGFVELNHGGASVVQLGNLRIAIARPPFSDGMEITAVRPIAKVRLEDYRLGENLIERLTKKQRGVLISGAPGSGKSTFAASIAEHLMNSSYIVKTMESPRDLQVSDAITQYSPLRGDMEQTADVLLLVRPDYTIYDEVRRTRDFQVFADMRLAGVGMIGVVHASSAVDAVQRLIGRVDLGVIPQVVDTVIYLEAGKVEKVYTLRFTVKVPCGMVEEDLARPVIVVEEFETHTMEYEIYTYGEQVIVMPATVEEPFDEKGLKELVTSEIEKHARKPFEINVLSKRKAVILCMESDIPVLIGRGGRNIEKIEKRVGMRLDVRPDKTIAPGKQSDVEIETTKRHLTLRLPEFASEVVEIFIDEEPAFSGMVSRKGEMRMPKNSQQAITLYQALKKNKQITVC